MNSQDLPTRFDFAAVEQKWNTIWESRGYFHPVVDPQKQPFSIAFPPPNVTGSLHMGHAANATLQDTLIRARRMQGLNTLWMLGTDHAGIATQYVVEKQLKQEEGKNRHDLGRDPFLERVWQWKEQYGGQILNQMHRLGASGDYQRARFTMDEGYSRAVRQVFVDWYSNGLIYRGLRCVNWCTRCLTTLSELELEHEERKDNFYYLRYFLPDKTSHLTIATVRPETIFADVAVAVHPEDQRYAHLIGKTVCLPLTGRELPVIADDYVDRFFGTGALKVTPAHDANDYEIGVRHQLPMLVALTEDGILNHQAGSYQGLPVLKAREAVAKDLEDQGFLEKTEPYLHDVGLCYRCHSVIEPYLSEQWFVKMQPLAEPAIAAIRSGEIRFTPARWGPITADWLTNVKDWCISRQLWWGHQIPVWYCQDCTTQQVSMDDLSICPACQSSHLRRDPDVLDTWFSSALWTFATLGWPERTLELSYFHPTAVLSTARDILNLWVARMIFCSLYFTKQVPFRDVLVHATILTKDGQRMSKSKGTGIDPLVMIDRYGADACRYWLAEVGMSGQDVRFSDEKLESSQHFSTKIWNASRFILLNLADFTPGYLPEPSQLQLADRWILSRLHTLALVVTRSIDDFSLTLAARQLYSFIWTEFCDWYLELAKPRLQGEGRKPIQGLLAFLLDKTLRLLHPFMPFITEELWASLKPYLNSPEPHLIVASWPQPALLPYQDLRAEQQMELLMDVIRTIRNLRMEMGVPANKLAETVILVNGNPAERHLLQDHAGYIATMGQIGQILVQEEAAVEQAAHGVSQSTQVILPLAGLIDFAKEKERLAKEIARLAKEESKLAERLGNPSFAAKAPADVVQKANEQLDELRFQQNLLQERLEAL